MFDYGRKLTSTAVLVHDLTFTLGLRSKLHGPIFGPMELFLDQWTYFRTNGPIFGPIDLFSDQWSNFRTNGPIFGPINGQIYHRQVWSG
jgi:hypothetical protein